MQRKGYQNLNSIGSVFGKNKVRKGTPDSTFRNPNGKFIFAEYTTQKDKLFDKISSDIEKCLDETRTEIQNTEIEKIIVCHTGRLETKEIKKLEKKTKVLEIILEIYSIESISIDLYNHFPRIANEFLGISVDTGQILELDDFVNSYGKSQYATPIDTEFCFREKEIKQVLSHLSSSQLVLISGSAGVGKTRLALEIIRKFKTDNPDYVSYIIRDRGQDLFLDLKDYFSQPNKFLLLVDDANRIGKFDYIIDLLRDCRVDQEFKVIATVRDYAIKKIKDIASSLADLEEISILSFKSTEIRELIKKIYNINNDLWLERICKISSGNPRIAVMASKIAVEEENLNSLQDVSFLYDKYFSSIRNDLQALEDTHVLKTAGIISLFRSLDRTNEQLMDMIQNIFNINATAFWKSAQLLHRHELVDIYENEVVKISDQVLATYLFYLCVFKNKEINLEIILEQLFPNLINRIQDAIYPCLYSFNFEDLAAQINPIVKNQWKAYINDNQTNKLHLLVKTFWFFLQTETLCYVSDQVHSMDAKDIKYDEICWEASDKFLYSDPLLSLLECFSQANDHEFKIALELICQYVEKNPEITPNVLYLLSKRFGFNRRSHGEDYRKQHILVDVFIECVKGEDNLFACKIFITLCNNLLNTQFDNFEFSDKKTLNHNTFLLLNTKALLVLREKIWDHLFVLFDNTEIRSDILNLLKNYTSSIYNPKSKEILEHDLQRLVPFLKSKLDPHDFRHCLIVNEYIKFVLQRKLGSSTEELSNQFNSDTYQVYKLLICQGDDNQEDNMNQNDFEQLKRKRIDKYTQQFDFQNYQSLLRVCKDIYEQLEYKKKHQIFSGIDLVFTTLYDRNPDLFASVMDYYLTIGEPFKFKHPTPLVEKLIAAIGLNDAKDLIEKYDFLTKYKWAFAFYQALKIEQITLKHTEQLYVIYNKATLEQLPYSFNYLLKFMEKDNQIIANIIKILVAKASDNKNYGRIFNPLFNSCSDVNRQLTSVFTGNEIVLKQAYLLLNCVNNNADYNGKSFEKIMNMDPNFLLECIDYAYSNDILLSLDHSFIWLRDDTEDIMTAAIEKIISYETAYNFRAESYMKCLFRIRNQHPNAQEIRERQDVFLKKAIKNNANNIAVLKLFFKIISCFNPDRRIPLVTHFLSINDDLETFKNICLEPDSYSWWGSAIPMYNKRIDYWKSLSLSCDSINLLYHRKYIEGHVQTLQECLEKEKKSEFIND